MFETDTVLPPDPVIEAYKKRIDRTLIRENLGLSVEERFDKLERLQRLAQELEEAGWSQYEIRRLTFADLKSIDSPPTSARRQQPAPRH